MVGIVDYTASVKSNNMVGVLKSSRIKWSVYWTTRQVLSQITWSVY